jgi:hypothetical protein
MSVAGAPHATTDDTIDTQMTAKRDKTETGLDTLSDGAAHVQLHTRASAAKRRPRRAKAHDSFGGASVWSPSPAGHERHGRHSNYRTREQQRQVLAKLPQLRQ